MSTIPLDSSLPPSIPLKYSIEGCSSYSVGYPPENILEDKPEDASSRWSTERSSNPEVEDSQWVTLKLEQLSVVTRITFGKFMKGHPCNISSFRVYGGLGTTDKEMHELLSGKLKDDHIPQTFLLNFKTPHARLPFPCRYIKICPMTPQTKSYNMSIWHIALSGITNPKFVTQVHDAYLAHKDTLALHLILKHLRRNNFSTAYQSLLEQTNIRTEHPTVTQLHDALVVRGDLVEAEHLVKRMAERDGLFDYRARVAQPMCVWKRLAPRGELPIGRGGHQLCLDQERGLIYLFGGWDGSRNLADFWSYSIAENRWSIIHHDTSAVGGPSARSCHNMIYSPTNKTIYVMGQLKEAPRAGGNPQPQPSDADFFKCAMNVVGGGAWTMLNPTGVEAAGGPPPISDHQMVIDEEKNLLYVFGGRIENLVDREGANLYSGMYTFNLGTETWSHIFNDPPRQEGAPSAQVSIFSRTGHGMVFYPPTHEIFIVGGRRSSPKWISDMHSFVHSPLSSQRLAFDPVIGNMGGAAPRVCIDEELGEIYVLIWQNNDRDRLRAAAPDPVTFATYHIEEKRWVRSEPYLGPFNASASGDVWEGLELPRPRSAHQVVYDSRNKVFYMFGGNSGEDGTPRLNDLWSMKLVRPTVQDLLRKALLAVRKFRFKDMCHTVPPFEALGYLQKEVTEVTDNDDEDEAAELRGLLSYLLSRASNGERTERGEAPERKARRELFDFLMQFVAPSEREPETELRDIMENV